ncbi:33542_t:CDS:1, partial [Gigaspora margarita]
YRLHQFVNDEKPYILPGFIRHHQQSNKGIQDLLLINRIAKTITLLYNIHAHVTIIRGVNRFNVFAY